MITIGNNIYRNLEEQVQKNKEDIARHWEVDRVLGDFGIKVLGKLPTADRLEQVDTSTLEYGDAYLIGEAEPYNVYVWTRANLNIGKREPYWLNIGAIAIEGPQGPRGEKGEKGSTGQSTRWYSGHGHPASLVKQQGDLYLDVSDGSVYQYGTNGWYIVVNIKGPAGPKGATGPQGEQGIQGPEGPQGERGESAGYINIIGILSNAGQLPTPASLDNMTYAYLVGTSEPHDVYIQVGTSPATSVWHNAGPLNGATLVQANGQYQATWNADTKIDKSTIPNVIYATDGNGNQTKVPYSAGVRFGGIAMRTSAGDIQVPNTPANDEAAINSHRARSLIASESQQVWLHEVETTDGDYISFLSVYSEPFLIEVPMSDGSTVYTLDPPTKINWNYRFNDQPIFRISAEQDTEFRISYYDEYESFMGTYVQIELQDYDDGRYSITEAINWY